MPSESLLGKWVDSQAAVQHRVDSRRNSLSVGLLPIGSESIILFSMFSPKRFLGRGRCVCTLGSHVACPRRPGTAWPSNWSLSAVRAIRSTSCPPMPTVFDCWGAQTSAWWIRPAVKLLFLLDFTTGAAGVLGLRWTMFSPPIWLVDVGWLGGW